MSIPVKAGARSTTIIATFRPLPTSTSAPSPDRKTVFASQFYGFVTHLDGLRINMQHAINFLHCASDFDILTFFYGVSFFLPVPERTHVERMLSAVHIHGDLWSLGIFYLPFKCDRFASIASTQAIIPIATPSRAREDCCC
jgi:hypothetical protein